MRAGSGPDRARPDINEADAGGNRISKNKADPVCRTLKFENGLDPSRWLQKALRRRTNASDVSGSSKANKRLLPMVRTEAQKLSENFYGYFY